MFGIIRTMFKTMFQSVVAMVTVFIFICLCCVGVVIAIGFLQDTDTRRVINDLNDGYGSEEKPLAYENVMRFDEGTVRATDIDRNGTQIVASRNPNWDAPAEGADWVAVWFVVECQQDVCRQHQLDFDLIDADGEDYDEHLVPYPDLLDDGVRGSTFEGWQIFEIPRDVSIVMVKVKWGGVTLYQEFEGLGARLGNDIGVDER